MCFQNVYKINPPNTYYGPSLQRKFLEKHFQNTQSQRFSIERKGIRIVFFFSKKNLGNLFLVISKQNSTNFVNFHRNFPIFISQNSKILLELNLEVNIPTNPKIQVPPQRDFHLNIYHLETLLLSSMVIYLLLSLKQEEKIIIIIIKSLSSMSKSWCTYLIATRPTYKCPSKHGTSCKSTNIKCEHPTWASCSPCAFNQPYFKRCMIIIQIQDDHINQIK